MSYLSNYKHSLPILLLSGFFLTSCQKSTNLLPSLPSNYDGATPGVVNLTVTPHNDAGASLLFEITGGTANIPIICSYYIFDYVSTTTSLINSENIYFSLDNTGSFNLEIANTKCSLGANTAAYITWQCYISAPPFTVLASTNEGANAFFFNCPI